MAITIKATLDASGVKVGAAQAGDAIGDLQNTAESSTQTLDQVADGLFSDLHDMKLRLEQTRAELAATADAGGDAFDEVGDAAEEAGRRMTSATAPGKSLQAATAVAASYLAVVNVIEKVAQFAEKANRAIVAMAEDGNPAAIKLAGSISQMKTELFAMAEDPIFQEMFSDIAELVESVVIPAIRKIPDVLVQIGDAMTDVQRRGDDMFGDIGKAADLAAGPLMLILDQIERLRGTTELDDAELSKMREVRDEGRKAAIAATELDRASREEKRKMQAAELDLARLEEQRFQRQFEAALDQIDSADELRSQIAAETEAIRERTRAGELSEDQRKRSLSMIEAAEARITRIQADNATAEKRQIDDVSKAREAAGKDAEKIAHDELAMREKLAAEEVALKQRAEQAKVDAERRSIEERKRLITGKDFDGAKQVLDAQSPEQIRQAILNKRGHDAEQQARRELDPKFDDDAAGKRRLESAVAKERQRAVANAKRAAGKISDLGGDAEIVETSAHGDGTGVRQGGRACGAKRSSSSHGQ